MNAGATENSQDLLFGIYDLDVEIAKLRKAGKDNERIEVKRCAEKVDKSFWESVSAFANTDGGLILLGLDEPAFTPTPGFECRKVQSQVTGGLRDIDQAVAKVTPVPEYRIASVGVDGAEILAVRIEPMAQSGRLSSRMPCFVSAKQIAKGSFKRVLDEDQLLNPYEIYSLSHRFEDDHTDVDVVDFASLKDLSEDRIEAYVRRLSEQGSRLLDDEPTEQEKLARLNIARDGKPTVAGILVFGRYPQQFFPQFFIDVTTHPDVKKGTGEGGQRFLSRRRCDGNLARVSGSLCVRL